MSVSATARRTILAVSVTALLAGVVPGSAAATPLTNTHRRAPVRPPSATRMTEGRAGVLPGVRRREITGDFVIRTDGQSLSDVSISGTLYVMANHVTVTNVRAASIGLNAGPQGSYAIPVKDSMTLSHVETGGIANVGGTHVTITDSRIGAGQRGTAIQLSNYVQPDCTYLPCDYVDLERNVVDGLASIPANSGVHSEAIHLLGVRHAVIRDNLLNWVAPDPGTWAQITAVLVMQGSRGVGISDVVVDHNDINGGSYYQSYLGGDGVVLTDNTFHTSSLLGRASPIYPLAAGDTLMRSGNYANGKPID